MELINNERKLMDQISKEPNDLDFHCFQLKWEVNFGKGVLGSLFKKGIVESEDMDGCSDYDPITDKVIFGVTCTIPYLTNLGEEFVFGLQEFEFDNR